MKEETPILYPNQVLGERVASYAASHTSGIPDSVVRYHAHVRETMPQTAMYMISLSQAQAMLFLSRTIGAKRVLEIGVYVGLSSMLWSHAVGPDGQVTGLEFESSFTELAEEEFAKQGIKNIELVVGDALKTLTGHVPAEPYDMIFIDAQKSGYPAYLQTILASSQPGSATRLLRPGGLIVADNILRCGFVADDSEDNPWREHDFGPKRPEYWKSDDIKALRRYNELVSASDRLDNWLCPLWDGVNIARLLD